MVFDEKDRRMSFWSINGWIILALIGVIQLNLIFCWSLNDEGIALLKFREKVVKDPYGALSSWTGEIGETNHCSWFGVECADGHVISLNLKNLCLEGTIAAELHHLVHIKSIILRNNSFEGIIPREIGKLRKLELLDLGYNNFSEQLRREFGDSVSIALSDNGLACHVSSELKQVLMRSEVQVEHNYTRCAEDTEHHRKLQQLPASISVPVLPLPFRGKDDHSPPDAPSANLTSPPPFDTAALSPPPPNATPPPPPTPTTISPPTTNATPSISPPAPNSISPPTQNDVSSSPSKKANPAVIVPSVVGGFLVLIVVIGLLLWGGNKIRKGELRASGLSGQLQKAFVSGHGSPNGLQSENPGFVEDSETAGIPNLKRTELETACEDFSNVIGTSSIGTMYKGTLSTGNEIAVISLVASSAKDWSKNLESHFRKKINTLLRINHKNFLNLIGYCEDEEPFTRMMVFEYAPNGSLFEHLHVKEAEHLDWKMRLRIAMGMAYCLEHIHQLKPPLTHPNLNSSAVNLSDDYAAKISDFCFWNEVASVHTQPIGLTSSNASASSPETNVYSFGLVLLEMMTGHIPHTLDDNSSAEEWVLEYLRGDKTLEELIDPMLRRYNPEQLEKISELTRKCLQSDAKLRPTMKDVAEQLREITTINPEKAGPRFTPQWWSELDSQSVSGEQ